MKVKVLHWNIWFQERAENIIEFVKEVNPDILCFQEVTIGSKFNNKKDVARFIANKLGYNYNFSNAHKYSFPITPKGESNFGGNAIFSKFPIDNNFNFPIVNRFDFKFLPYERRTCATSKVKLPNGKFLYVATTHSSYNNKFGENKSKIREVKKLVRFFKKRKQNLIFTGDLNVSPNSKSIKLIEKSLTNCGPDYSQPTWTTKPFDFQGFKEDKLRWRVDYVFATKDVKVLNSKILKTKYSDHLPILVEFEI